MKHEPTLASRRSFLRLGANLALAAPWVLTSPQLLAQADEPTPTLAAPQSSSHRSDAKVAIVACSSYGPEAKTAMEQAFDLIGGIQGLVRGKTVTVKINLTGTNFRPLFKRPVGESYMTHYATAMALGTLLFTVGARRVRFVESTNRPQPLEQVLGWAGWDVNALRALGKVEFEDTRNLGQGKRYAHLKVPRGGHLYSSFEVNHSYADTDVMVSLTKLKEHSTTGVTLAMKNLFGVAPNSLYGDQAGSEDALAGRGPLHDPRSWGKRRPPGEKTGDFPLGAGYRVPRIVADICAARPIHLSIIDGITSMSGGEGPWCGEVKFTTPHVLLVGLNPVSTDAVSTAVMGFADPRAKQGTPPYEPGDNHLVLAEELGIGTAELSQIEVLGKTIARARYPYRNHDSNGA